MQSSFASRLLRFAALSLIGLLACAEVCHAQQVHVALDTSGLTAGSVYYLELQLVDGSGTGDNNSQAAITDFSASNGALGGILPPLGNVSGTLNTTLTLADGPPPLGSVADWAQAFTLSGAGSSLAFNLQLAATSVDAGNPDGFSLLILDSNLAPLATNAPGGIDYVTADFTTTSPVPIGYFGSGVTTQITIGNMTVPEPGAPAFLIALVLGSVGLVTKPRTK